MQNVFFALSLALLVGCTPAECSDKAPVELAAIPGLRLLPDTTGVTLKSSTPWWTGAELLTPNYSCPAFDLTTVTGQVGDAPLGATYAGGPNWHPPSIYSDGVCYCHDASMSVAGGTSGSASAQPISSTRYDVTLSQGSARIKATYFNVSNSVQVVEETSPDAPPNRRAFRFFSGFNRTYWLSRDALNDDRGPVGTTVKVVARYQGANVFATIIASSQYLVLQLSGPADEFTFEVENLFHDISPSECLGPATCEPLRVVAPTQTLTL